MWLALRFVAQSVVNIVRSMSVNGSNGRNDPSIPNLYK